MEGDAMPCFMLRGAKQLAKASANPCAEARLPSYPMPFPPLCLLPSEPGGGGGQDPPRTAVWRHCDPASHQAAAPSPNSYGGPGLAAHRLQPKTLQGPNAGEVMPASKQSLGKILML